MQIESQMSRRPALISTHLDKNPIKGSGRLAEGVKMGGNKQSDLVCVSVVKTFTTTEGAGAQINISIF